MESVIQGFIKSLKDILHDPPYISLFFICSILLLITIYLQRYWEPVFVLFIYSAAETIWRYVSRDIDNAVKAVSRDEQKKAIWHLKVVLCYHSINILLFTALVGYLHMKGYL